jgi:RND family efflux transporter MFP subunit
MKNALIKTANKQLNPLVYLIFTLLIGLSVILQPGCSREKTGEDGQSIAKNPVTVKVEPVRRGPVVYTLEYKGTVFPWRRANIGPDTSGRIKKIYKKQGDRVRKGTLLAELDTTTLDLQLKQAQAALEAARASHKDALLNANRLRKLLKKKAISRMQLEKAELGLEAAETGEKSARATLAVIRHNLDNAYMRAPFDGIVTSKNAEEGDVINPMMGMGASVLTLMNLEKVKVIVDAPSEEIEKIEPAQPCAIRVTTLPNETFPGSVYTKNLAADPVSKTFKVEIEIENPGLKIKSGIFADVSIEISRKDNCLIIPARALVQDGGRRYVVVYRDGKALFKTVAVGEQNRQVAEILEGLAPGERVIVQGNYDLKEGARVTYEGARQ